MSESALPQVRYIEFPPVLNYFRLRPEVTWAIVCTVVFYASVLTVKWTEPVNTDEFLDYTQFEMVELEIPVPVNAVPDIQIQEEAIEEPVAQKEQQMKFGKDTGDHLNSAFAITAPRLRVDPPAFPDSVKNLGVEGTVVVEFNIDENGNVVYGRVAKKLHPVIDQLVFDWAKNASFYPALDPEGKAFKIKFFLPIRYRLE